ncbi:MAG: hypothetical protein V4485_03990 [Pseudomonadota bacterium]
MAKEMIAMVAIAAASVSAHAASKFELAAEAMGFNGKYIARGQPTTSDKATEQEALLKIFYLAGYFEPHKLWEDINRMGGFKDPLQLFKSIYTVVIASGANQPNPAAFNAKLLREGLMNTDTISIHDAADLILYIGQHAFGRKAGQERNELSSQGWMAKHKREYFEAARKLGLIDRMDPSHEAYDAAWIAGASRIGLIPRIIDFKHNLEKGLVVKGNTSILAGQRELWANIDGVNPEVLRRLLSTKDIDTLETSLSSGEDIARVEEGQDYLKTLAHNTGIRLNPDDPLIQYAQGDAPSGRVAGRVYANYAEGETRKLTESLLAQDLIKQFELSAAIVDTASEGAQRPNTATTAKDAALEFIANIDPSNKEEDKKEFHVLLQSNQPYTERQTLSTQAAVDEALKNSGLWNKGYRIIVDGVGFGCRQDAPAVHSELGALIAEMWKAYNGSLRNIASLLFQQRDNDKEVPPYPDVSEWNSKIVGVVHAEESE